MHKKLETVFRKVLLKERPLHGALINQFRHHVTDTRLTPSDVSQILRRYQYATDHKSHFDSVKGYDMNSLPSNIPTEDGHVEGMITNTNGLISSDLAGAMLFGVIDGHGGASCGQVVTRRILDYVAASLLSPGELKSHCELLSKHMSQSPSEKCSIVKNINFKYKFLSDLQRLYNYSYLNYVQKLMDQVEANPEVYQKISVVDRLKNAFNSLDDDMSNEAMLDENLSLMPNKTISADLVEKTRNVSMSGACANVVYINKGNLHVASTGDCTAVLGSLSENNTWVAKKLTTEHNADNASEIKRIQSEHSTENMKNIIKCERLLGILAPLRAFGDFRFKWKEDVISRILGNSLGKYAVPSYYKSPPYLTCEPEVAHHKLHPRDKFLVVATDGLWDMMNPMQVIRLVGEHMSGKQTLTPFEVEDQYKRIRIGDISERLRRRQAFMRLKPVDENAATHIIRSALGSTAYGLDHARLSQMLSMPPDTVRMFRDDITILVIFFDSEFVGRH